MKTTESKQNQTFTFDAPAASRVSLAGNFTNWQQHPIRLRKLPEGGWATTVALKPGTYYYRFLVDGEWRDDPQCMTKVRNPFGTEDAVLVVAASESTSSPPAVPAARGS